MLSLEQIRSYYPKALQNYGRFMIREYLQYKILEIVFESPYQAELAFLGGTCLRIVHDNQRFSEDLDFDHFKLTAGDFDAIAIVVEAGLKRLGYEVEMRNVKRGAYHCYVRFPGLLFKEGLTGHKTEKILICLDSEAHGFDYQPDRPMLNKFDVFTQINATPRDILLAQKFYAILNRKRSKGRDFFDVVYLLGQGITPNYAYLQLKLGIGAPEDLRRRIIDRCAALRMADMAGELSPFLFDKRDEKRVLLFPRYMEQVKLN